MSSVDLEKSPLAIPVMSAIVERTHRGRKQILVQTRIAPYDKMYFGCLEIPAGRIEAFENIYDTIPREIFEETGLSVVEVLPQQRPIPSETDRGDAAFVFEPFCCQQLLRGNIPWVGFVFLVRVADEEPRTSTDETKDVRWIDLSELEGLIAKDRQRIFTLQLPVLEFYLKHEGY